MQRVNHRTAYIDVLSVLAALAVVSLHTNGCFWQFSATERYWKTANIIEGLCYFAVPIFFMINGATLIDYRSRYSTVEFFKKRVMKTVIPFISWSLIGILFRLYYLKDLKIEELSMRWIVQGINHTSIVASLLVFSGFVFSISGDTCAVCNTGRKEKSDILLHSSRRIYNQYSIAIYIGDYGSKQASIQDDICIKLFDLCTCRLFIEPL